MKWLIRGRQDPKIPTVLKKQDGSYTTNIDETIKLIMSELIPHSDNDPQPTTQLHGAQSYNSQPAIANTDELRAIVWRKKNRAPGADGLTAKIIKAAWPVINNHLLKIINNCLTQEVFPNRWKHASVVVLLKGKNKDPLKPRSYRPVSLLPV